MRSTEPAVGIRQGPRGAARRDGDGACRHRCHHLWGGPGMRRPAHSGQSRGFPEVTGVLPVEVSGDRGGLRRLSLAIAGRSESPPGSVRSRRNGACDGRRSSDWNPPEPRLRRGPAATLHGAPQEGGTMASKARLLPLFRGWTGFPR